MAGLGRFLKQRRHLPAGANVDPLRFGVLCEGHGFSSLRTS
jgi:hypothetical protein